MRAGALKGRWVVWRYGHNVDLASHFLRPHGVLRKSGRCVSKRTKRSVRGLNRVKGRGREIWHGRNTTGLQERGPRRVLTGDGTAKQYQPSGPSIRDWATRALGPFTLKGGQEKRPPKGPWIYSTTQRAVAKVYSIRKKINP